MHSTHSPLLLAATITLVATMAASASGQHGRPTAPAGPGAATTGDPARRLPRTPWGHPDLQGRWTNATLTPLERPAELGAKEFFSPGEAAEYAKSALQKFIVSTGQAQDISAEQLPDLWGEPRTIVPTLRTSLIVGPTGRLPSLTPQARQRAAARAASGLGRTDSPEERPLNERCLWFNPEGPTMLPSITYNSNYEIVQTPTYVAIHIEMGDGFRIIPLDGRPHLPQSARQWLGDSRGHWDGDTLVVDTTNVSPKRDVRGSSDGLHVVERFTRTADNRLMYRFTADDPTTWTEPWSAEIPMTPLDGLIYEYACHEGNRSLENILRAARTADGAAGGQTVR